MKEYRIKVLAEQKRESVERARDGRLLVSVNAKRVEGKANERARGLVAEFLSVPVCDVSIVRGHNLPTKTIRVRTA